MVPRVPILYYITDRKALAADELTRRRRILGKIAEATRAGVDYIQLREKDLGSRELESLARDAVRAIWEANQLASGHRTRTTALLINSRTDFAIAAGADGVHLRSQDITPQEVRTIWKQARTEGAGISRPPLIGVSCHSITEVKQAEANGATFAVFAPVFEKKDAPGTHPAGLNKLSEACRAKIPVLALGGITLANARACLSAGAAGIAAIRLFQENDISEVAATLRSP